MIKISLDEAYVFDILSILDLKTTKNSDPEIVSKNLKNYLNLSDEIISQIGLEKYNEIINSEEYKNLFTQNSRTFDLVDESRNDTGLAKIVLEANNVRFDCKNALQRKFFNVELSEVKMNVK